MSNFQSISYELVKSLELQYEPVGVTLYTLADRVPADVPFAEGNFKSYCQALALAGKGRTPLLKKEQMGCKLGTSVLGFEKDTDMAKPIAMLKNARSGA